MKKENKLDYESEGSGIGLCRVLFIALAGLALVFLALLTTGCATIKEYAHDALENATGGNTDAQPVNADAVDYSLLQWEFGGFNGANARLDTPRLSGASCDGRTVFYKWDVGLDVWGMGHDNADAVCALFIERSDGSWTGGKFDWVSTSRTSRGLGHLEGYNGWSERLPLTGRVAFVVVTADGARRSNVIMAEVK